MDIETGLSYAHFSKSGHPANISDEIIQQLGEACNELSLTATSEAHSRSTDEDAVEFNSQVYTQRRGRPAFEIKEEELSPLVAFFLTA